MAAASLKVCAGRTWQQGIKKKQVYSNNNIGNWGLTLSAPWAKSWTFADGIDQDQTAQNVQSDLDLCRPLDESDICGTINWGPLWILFTVVERDRF